MDNNGRNERTETLTPTEARQGRRGYHVLTILIVALILAMGVWWGVEIYGGAIEPAATEQVGDPATVEGGTSETPVNPAN